MSTGLDSLPNTPLTECVTDGHWILSIKVKRSYLMISGGRQRSKCCVSRTAQWDLVTPVFSLHPPTFTTCRAQRAPSGTLALTSVSRAFQILLTNGWIMHCLYHYIGALTALSLSLRWSGIRRQSFPINWFVWGREGTGYTTIRESHPIHLYSLDVTQ